MSKGNLTLENLDEDIAKVFDRLHHFDGYQKHAEAYMKHVGDVLDELRAEVSAIKRTLAAKTGKA